MSAPYTPGPAWLTGPPRCARYVVGFMFGAGDYANKVALIEKVRPEWQAGRMNGIGGKIEWPEASIDAMVREFREEAGYVTVPGEWHRFAVLMGRDWEVVFYWAFGRLAELKTQTDEQIRLVPVEQINDQGCLPNLTWLIPMARSMHLERADYFSIMEEGPS